MPEGVFSEFLLQPLLHSSTCAHYVPETRYAPSANITSGRKNPAKYQAIDHQGPSTANATGTIPKRPIRTKLLKTKPVTLRRSTNRSPLRIVHSALRTPQIPPAQSANTGCGSHRNRAAPVRTTTTRLHRTADHLRCS